MGGNSKPQTYRICDCCGEVFGPLQSLKSRFCSKYCSYDWQVAQPKKSRMKLSKEARSIQRRSRYLIESGQIKKKVNCESCGKLDKLEIAHYNYREAERFRQLCISCHRRWDKAKPKYSGKEAVISSESAKEGDHG